MFTKSCGGLTFFCGLRRPQDYQAKEQVRWLMEHPTVAEMDVPCGVGGAAKELLGNARSVKLFLWYGRTHRCGESLR
jgi:hypothetical protein